MQIQEFDLNRRIYWSNFQFIIAFMNENTNENENLQWDKVAARNIIVIISQMKCENVKLHAVVNKRLCKFDFVSLNKNRERIETNSSLSSARGFRGSSRSSMYIPTTLYFLPLAKNLILTRHWENSLRDVKKILWDTFVNA